MVECWEWKRSGVGRRTSGVGRRHQNEGRDDCCGGRGIGRTRQVTSVGGELKAGKKNGRERTGRGAGEWILVVLQKELLEGELLHKVIPKRGLRRIKPAVGGKDVKAAN